MRIQGIYPSPPQKKPKFDLTTDAEYVANLVSCQFVVLYMLQYSLLHGYAMCMHNDIFLTDIVGYDRLKFS